MQTRLLTKQVIQESKDEESKLYYPFRVGTKGYEYVEEDLNLLKELGIQIYRFSLSWARLFQKELKKNQIWRAFSTTIRFLNFVNRTILKFF